MSQAGSQATAFYRDVAKTGRLWTIRDGAGFPAPPSESSRAMPFWSTRKRALRVVTMLEAYRGFEVFELSHADFVGRWLPGLERDGSLVGLNWTGTRATGFDVHPSEVQRILALGKDSTAQPASNARG